MAEHKLKRTIIGYHVHDDRDRCGDESRYTDDCGPTLRLYRTQEQAVAAAEAMIRDPMAHRRPSMASRHAESRMRGLSVTGTPFGLRAVATWDYRLMQTSTRTESVEVDGATYQRTVTDTVCTQDWAPLREQKWGLMGHSMVDVVTEWWVGIDEVTVEYMLDAE